MIAHFAVDYAFDVSEDTKGCYYSFRGERIILLNGGISATILDSIYAYGSLSAREMLFWTPLNDDASATFYVAPPCTDFTFGIQNIPQESSSYSDDGQTLFFQRWKVGA
jgi:hypothetical protein